MIWKSGQTENERLGFGYVSDIDIMVDGIKLMSQLGF